MPTIYAEKCPAGVTSLTKLKDGEEEIPIGARADVVKKIQSVVPFADFTEEFRISLDVGTMWLSIELEGDDDSIELATFESSDHGVMVAAIAGIMQSLGAIGQLETGEDFNPATDVPAADTSLWKTMRDELLKQRI